MIESFTFGENDSRFSATETHFKAKTGQKYLISFSAFKGIEKCSGGLDYAKMLLEGSENPLKCLPKFEGGSSIFIRGVGNIIDPDPEIVGIAKQSDPKARAKDYVLCPIVLWPVNASKGTLNKGALFGDDCEVEVKPWKMSRDKYNQIKGIFPQYPFVKHDLNMSCTDETYQKLDFLPNPNSALLAVAIKAVKEENAECLALMKLIFEQTNTVYSRLGEVLGRKVTAAEVREKMAGSGSAPEPMVNATSSIEVEDALHSMLDD